MLIDCEKCAMRETPACDDCVVTYLLDHSPMDLEESEVIALRNLADAGLVPKLRLVPGERQAG